MFDPVEYAKNELAPILEQICAMTEQQAQRDQTAFFGRILAGIRQAKDAEDLAPPFMDLSTSAFLGFDYGLQTTFLLDQVLEKAQHLSEALSIGPDEVH